MKEFQTKDAPAIFWSLKPHGWDEQNVCIHVCNVCVSFTLVRQTSWCIIVWLSCNIAEYQSSQYCDIIDIVMDVSHIVSYRELLSYSHPISQNALLSSVGVLVQGPSERWLMEEQVHSASWETRCFTAASSPALCDIKYNCKHKCCLSVTELSFHSDPSVSVCRSHLWGFRTLIWIWPYFMTRSDSRSVQQDGWCCLINISYMLLCIFLEVVIMIVWCPDSIRHPHAADLICQSFDSECLIFT